MSDEHRQPCPECDGSWVVYWDETTKAPRCAHTEPACEYWRFSVALASALRQGQAG